LIRELKRDGVRPDFLILRDMLYFALPFVPGGIGAFIMNSGDRFFLLEYSGEADVGVYALGYKLAWAVELFTKIPLGMVWGARMYADAERSDAADYFGKVFKWIIGAQLAGSLAVCLFQDEIVVLLGGKQYVSAAHIISPVVLACLFSTAASLFDAGFYIRRRT